MLCVTTLVCFPLFSLKRNHCQHGMMRKKMQYSKPSSSSIMVGIHFQNLNSPKLTKSKHSNHPIPKCQNLKSIWIILLSSKTHHPSPRDYKADVEAITASKLPTWKLEHFGAWQDLCAPPAMPAALPSAAEVLELEDQANAARFRELRAKISQDCASMTQFNAQSEEGKRRSHVVQVTHERSQIEVGKKLLG